jgi:hypothetical protein
MKYELKVKPGIDTPPFVFEEGAQPFETADKQSSLSQFWRGNQNFGAMDPTY